jgi:hypothetical protein
LGGTWPDGFVLGVAAWRRCRQLPGCWWRVGWRPCLVVPARSAASLAGVDDPAARGRLEDERLKLQNDVRAC